MSKIYLENFHYQPRRDTAAQWQSNNPVLCDGEIGIVTDGTATEWLKVGDGTTPWNQLPYKKGPKGEKGDTGAQGDKGDKGDKGERGFPAVTDQTYSPTSQNAQSGRAVATAIANKADTSVMYSLDSNRRSEISGLEGRISYLDSTIYSITSEIYNQGGIKEKADSALQSDDIDQTYSPTSENAQSGKAVAEAVKEEEQRSNNVFANALKGSASGSAVRMDDTSPVEHTIGVKVKRKNLFKIGTNSDYTTNTLGCTVSGDTLVGESVPSASNFVINKNTAYSAGKYTLSQTTSAETTSSIISRFFIRLYDNDNNLIGTPNLLQGFVYNAAMKGYITATSSDGIIKDTITVEIPDGVAYWKRGFCFYVYPHVDGVLVTISNIQTELGTTATAYTPYVPDLTATKVMRYGKNLINSALWSTASSGKGLTIQYLPDEDCFVANGTITPTSSETSADIGIKSVNIPINKGKKYTLSVKYVSGESEMSNLHFVCRDALGSGGNQVIRINPALDKQDHTATSIVNATAIKDVRFYFYVGGTTSKTVTNYKFRIQLEESDVATDYEPYQSKTEHTPAADGTVEGVKSLYPTTTLIPDTEGLILEADYNRDINKAFAELQQAIISLGGNV